MSYNYAAPEELGISSAWIQEYIDVLESSHLATHDLIILRKGKIVFEHYWKPFHREFRHRMYSVTKSFVSLAVGFLEQEGKISLDDPISKYFPEESKNSHPYLKAQTIRHMLMMATAMPNANYFKDQPADRVVHYFDKPAMGAKPSGTVFNYDSEGSFLLGAMVERVTGMRLMDFLKDRLFDKIGVGELDCLECPGGHSWSDSALLCRPIDLLRVAEFCMNKGEGILNEEYVTAATSKQIDNSHCGAGNKGYGYQFWRYRENSFGFIGMGCQYALCLPDQELILVYNGDNQGNTAAQSIIFENFFDMIACRIGEPLPPAPPVNTEGLTLYHATGEKHVALEQQISGKVYKMEENPMGITEFSIVFEENRGILRYTNAQGQKQLPFGLCENVYGDFPQQGYSDRVGSQPGNRLYRCAASGAWVGKKNLFIKVQIIDTYFGNLNINIGFEGKGIGILMTRNAEWFLLEYEGFAGGSYE
ncbi:MAG: serine hydrolase [Clostridia bacterium]|nr:serine hydrolase [Clostridia bacterium]